MNNDCWLNTFLYLPFDHILNCILTCKQFNEILNGNTYWQSIINQDYGYQLNDNNYKDKYRQHRILDRFLQSKIGKNINKIKKFLGLISCKLESLPNEIHLLINLNEIMLDLNMLTVLPSGLCQLHNLTSLVCNSNKLQSLPPEIGNLTNLRQLLISCNELESFPSEIGQLTKINYLYAQHNKLQLLPTEIKHLTKLKYLVLEHDNYSA